MNDDRPSISVVVIGRNEGERLRRCLASIRDADYPQDRIELIYVDSDSTDDSCEIAAQFDTKVVRIQPRRPCAAVGRNAGLRVATHDLVHFFDGDTIVNAGWFENAVLALADPRVACVFGRRDEIAPRATIYNFWAHHDWYVDPGPAESCAGDALFRRDILEQMHGYDESLIAGEEPDLCYRIRRDKGMTILRLDKPMTRHDMNMTRFGQYWRRCVRTGHAYAEVGGRHRGMYGWRKARWRNLAYAASVPLCLLLSALLWSFWPLVAWALLLGLAVMRNALRLRFRVDSIGGALLYSAHHYICKLPAAIGQCHYWYRLALRRTPQPLIEYR